MKIRRVTFSFDVSALTPAQEDYLVGSVLAQAEADDEYPGVPEPHVSQYEEDAPAAATDAETLATAVLGLGTDDELPPEVASAAHRVLRRPPPRPGARPYTYDDEIAAKLTAAGLPTRPCGLNADWSVRAWHLGPKDHPKRHDGDVYLLDDESDHAQTFSVVRYYPSRDGVEEMVSVCCTRAPLAIAVALAVSLLEVPR